MRKNFFYTVLLTLVNLVFPLISFPYAARILGPTGIGEVQFIVSFAQYFALFAALGIPIYGVSQAAKCKDDPQKLSNLFIELNGINAIASLVCFLGFILLIYTLPYFKQEQNLYLLSSSLILLSFSYTDWYYAGTEAFKTIALRSVLIKSISLVLLVLLVKTELDYPMYLGIIIFSILGHQMIGMVSILRKIAPNISGLEFQKHFNPLFFIFASALASSIYTSLDTVLLGFLADKTSVGFYTSSIKLIKLSIPFVTAMGVILIPKISKAILEKEMEGLQKLLNTSFEFLVFVAVPASIGLYLLAPELILLFSGKAFQGAVLPMQILSGLPLLIGFGHFFAFQILIPAEKNKELFYCMGLGLLVFIISNFLWVPLYQATGSAMATLMTELTVSLGYLYFVKKYYAFHYDWKFFIESLFCSLLFVPLIYWIKAWQLSLWLGTLLSILLAVFIYFLAQIYLCKNRFILNFILPILAKLRGENK